VKQPAHDSHRVTVIFWGKGPIGTIAARSALRGFVRKVGPTPGAGTGLWSTALSLLRPRWTPVGACTGPCVSAAMATGGFRRLRNAVRLSYRMGVQ